MSLTTLKLSQISYLFSSQIAWKLENRGNWRDWRDWRELARLAGLATPMEFAGIDGILRSRIPSGCAKFIGFPNIKIDYFNIK
jgi:hypothetical protein